MESFDLDRLVRQNIKNLIPYSSARDEFKGSEGIFLDANENAFGTPTVLPSPLGEGSGVRLNRYPDPLQLKLKEKISSIKGVPTKNIFLGNGSDEAIDILYRIFCRPGVDNVILLPPTYGMYEVAANINDIETRKINLTPDFQLNLDAIAEAVDENTKLIFICSPNNPTGNSIHHEAIEAVLNNFDGIVVLDEAYINFAKQKSFISELVTYPNLVVMQTLSKAWGLAGLRLGLAFAGEQIINLFNKVKPPYNVNSASQEIALRALDNLEQVNQWTKEIVSEREKLAAELKKLSFVQHIYPSDANFILVKVDDPKKTYTYLVDNKIIVRDRSKVELCEGCLRITIGTPKENQQLLFTLQKYSN